MAFNALPGPDSPGPGFSGPGHRLGLTPTNTIADQVVEEILRAIDAGEFMPGEAINDVDMAARFGVSRTPVREALQRLRVFCVIETAASRYTRIAHPGRNALIEGRVVWVALLGAIVEEIAANPPAMLRDQLNRNLADLRHALDAADDNAAIASVSAYFQSVVSYSRNRTLLESLSAYLHLFGLAVRSVAGPGNAGSLLVILFAIDADHSLLHDLARALPAGDRTTCHDVLRRMLATDVPEGWPVDTSAGRTHP
ncbi:MAG: GntR family transcriptional regulator [Microbacteriaceae bacterium]|nr:MAG: GntR family transcriptional regulator [Microbacteriaceae bacterium]